MFSKKATKIDEIFTVDVTSRIDGEDFVDFCGFLRKHQLYMFFSQDILVLVWILRFTVKNIAASVFVSKFEGLKCSFKTNVFYTNFRNIFSMKMIYYQRWPAIYHANLGP